MPEPAASPSSTTEVRTEKPAPAAPPSQTGATLAASAERLAAGAGRSAERLAVGAGAQAKTVWRELVERRGLRIAVAGVVLILAALWIGTGTALGLVCGIAGAVMLLVGAMGPRLRGRVSLEFGPGGTSFELTTHVAPPGRVLIAPSPDEDLGRPQISLVPAIVPEPEEALVVEGSGETIEIDVEQLKRLLAQQK